MGATANQHAGDHRPSRARRALAAAAIGAFGVMPLAAVAASAPAAAATPTLHIMVTNDDGYSAPGINNIVQALRKLPNTSVTVVAPYTNQSGTGGKTTNGPLTVTNAKTQSGYPAKAVHGYPADTVVWAIQEHHLAQRPDLVVSGINWGQNIGAFSVLSGTVGAAAKALANGVPALAVSQGFNNHLNPKFQEGVHFAIKWIDNNRSAILAVAKLGKNLPAANLNIPSCAAGTSVIRGPIHVAQASKADTDKAYSDPVTCGGPPPAKQPLTDSGGFLDGYATLGPLTPTS